MAELFRVIVDALNLKERTAKVYAATIRRIHREVYKKELEDEELKFLRLRKTFNYVSKIVNLTRRKNAATAILTGLKATKAPAKLVDKFRTIMMDADKDYQHFLVSGKRKRPFEDAEEAWKLVVSLHKKVNQEIVARRLWDVGSHVTANEYRVLQAWVYLKWLAAMPPRRLEYATMNTTPRIKVATTLLCETGGGPGIFTDTKRTINMAPKSYRSPGRLRPRSIALSL